MNPNQTLHIALNCLFRRLDIPIHNTANMVRSNFGMERVRNGEQDTDRYTIVCTELGGHPDPAGGTRRCPACIVG